VRYLSLILAEKIVALLDESGATECQKLAALDAAKAIVPVSLGAICTMAEEGETTDSPAP
jgi:hypothetical protein